MNTDFLKTEDRIALRLKSLYQSYGYEEYKLSSFEEYALFAENESFLPFKDVIAIQVGGKLLALRPDVTLCIAKAVNAAGTRKYYYDETVHRRTAGGSFAEVRQIGVEIIGRVDGVARAELCALMLGTMEAAGKDFVIDASHMGIVVKTLALADLSVEDRKFALDCLRGKNAHDFSRFAARKGISPSAAAAFGKLIGLPSDPSAALKALADLGVDLSAEIAELRQLIALSGGRVNVDFSIVGDADYYNGLIFKGYVAGVPHAVLSGGRYDKLLNKFGKQAEAVGFALYLGELGRALGERPRQPDAAVIYGDRTEEEALALAARLRGEGESVLICRELPAGFAGRVWRTEVKE